ncbi:hypothetical protein C7M84_009536 [Penaeus vannamei]|uniref:Ig-like domain-containing protein n=1 Tax=Penaeus vannamei TaxID=6689 RepID=A0A423UAE7_PENVA|nr:hypothetical protein C7M84_009536 [Penaeus vannamei]
MMDPEMFADVMVFALYTSSEPTVALVPETLRAPFLLSHDRTSREMERVPRRHTCCLRSLSCDTRLTRPLLRRRTARGSISLHSLPLFLPPLHLLPLPLSIPPPSPPPSPSPSPTPSPPPSPTPSLHSPPPLPHSILDPLPPSIPSPLPTPSPPPPPLHPLPLPHSIPSPHSIPPPSPPLHPLPPPPLHPPPPPPPPNTGRCLRMSGVWVPPVAVSGTEVKFTCHYETSPSVNDTLYSLKWYRGHDQFYEYIPKNKPPMKVYESAHVHVDKSQSDANTVVLKGITRETSGSFQCEVMGDKPLFETDNYTKNMTVVDIPTWGPRLTHRPLSSKVGVQDIIQARCEVGPSDPPTEITWLINRTPAPPYARVETYKNENRVHVRSNRLLAKVRPGRSSDDSIGWGYCSPPPPPPPHHDLTLTLPPASLTPTPPPPLFPYPSPLTLTLTLPLFPYPPLLFPPMLLLPLPFPLPLSCVSYPYPSPPSSPPPSTLPSPPLPHPHLPFPLPLLVCLSGSLP